MALEAVVTLGRDLDGFAWSDFENRASFFDGVKLPTHDDVVLQYPNVKIRADSLDSIISVVRDCVGVSKVGLVLLEGASLNDLLALDNPFGEFSKEVHLHARGYGRKLSKEEGELARHKLFEHLNNVSKASKHPVAKLVKPGHTLRFLRDAGTSPTFLSSSQRPQRAFLLLDWCEFGKGHVPDLDYHEFPPRKVLIKHFSLKKRKFIGPTSMDAELAFYMASLANVSKGKIVLDPFVGTGSVLVACTVFGGTCFGVDIHHELTKGMKFRNYLKADEAFKQYDLRVPEWVRGDASRDMYARGNLFDAIVTDPPYGVRAGAKKISTSERVKTSGNFRVSPYDGKQVLLDLLDFSAHALVLNGRVVLWAPCIVAEYVDEENSLPTHPAMELKYNIEQKLTMLMSRRLLVYEKVSLKRGNATVKDGTSLEDLTAKVMPRTKKARKA